MVIQKHVAIAILLICIVSIPFLMKYFFFSPPKIVMSYFVPEDTLTISPIKQLTDKIDRINVIAYAFLHVDPNGKIKLNDDTLSVSSFNFFSIIHDQRGSLKKIISLGGADDRKSFFYAIKNVDNFVSSAHLLIEKYQLAGFDLDFEINRPYTVEEAKLFADVVAKLRQKLGSKTFITVPTIIDQETLKSMGKDNWKIIANNANFISMMCYDLSSPDYTEFASNLYLVPNAPKPLHNATLSCDQSIKYLIALGVPPAKIVLGIPAFAISSGGVRAVNDGLFQPSDKAQAPTFDDMGKGLLRYSTVRHLNKLGFERHLSMSNGNVDGVWLYNPEQHQFITFDNPQSVHEKVDYVLKNKLGGVMMWRIGQDVSIENKESLLKTIAEGLH